MLVFRSTDPMRNQFLASFKETSCYTIEIVRELVGSGSKFAEYEFVVVRILVGLIIYDHQLP